RAPLLRLVLCDLDGGLAVAVLRRLLDLRLLALFADDGDRAADLDLALAHLDLQQHARRLRLDLLGHLLGVELVERLALLDPVALALQPLDDRPGLHPLAEAGKLDLSCHSGKRSCRRPRARPPRAG